MSPEPLVPDFVPDELVAQYGGDAARRRRPRRRDARGGVVRELPASARHEAAAARRRAGRLEVVAVITAVELALLGVIAIALWWSSLAASSGSWLWTAFTYGGWVLAFHLPVVLAALVLHTTGNARR